MMSVKELKHFAEDAKKPQSEIDAITQPEMRSGLQQQVLKYQTDGYKSNIYTKKCEV